jgi:glutathione synthase/RimK-type ligase-like ATP-grasp enzyme
MALFRKVILMVKILIPTKPDDTHAIFVKLALEEKGHEAVLWYTADFPGQQTHSFDLHGSDIRWRSNGTEFNVINNNEFDVVWLRRPRRPALPDFVHSDDRENALNEVTELYKTFWQVIAPHAFWINPLNAARTVNCKLQQLKAAVEVGLTIPDTLISNDPLEIKSFIEHNRQAATIYKTLYPTTWVGKDYIHLTYTKEITQKQLPSDAVLQITPSIFQKKIPKAYELRINFFGDQAITAKLKSQEHARGKMDWRYVPPSELKIEEFELPDIIYKKCKAFMEIFGIVFGCFDFIVTPENEYYFLEINEQGQFLWIEDVNPKIKLLDCFTNFLIARSRNFSWNKSAIGISIGNYRKQMVKIKENAIKNHKTPANNF